MGEAMSIKIRDETKKHRPLSRSMKNKKNILILF